MGQKLPDGQSLLTVRGWTERERFDHTCPFLATCPRSKGGPSGGGSGAGPCAGCGKTSAAEVLANELGVELGVVRLDAVMSSYQGESAATCAGCSTS